MDPLITIFNGRKRSLGDGEKPELFLQVSLNFLSYLREFRGSTLSVLMAIALRANESGWAWPSVETIQQDTGLSRNAVFAALNELCQKRVNGQRVMLRCQVRKQGGRFGTNCYLIFPSAEEEQQYDGVELADFPTDGVPTVYPQTVYQKVVHGGSPCTTFTNAVKVHPNNNHDLIELEPEKEEEEEEKKENARNEIPITAEIQRVLEESGVFPQTAAHIARQMAALQLTANDALRILLATLDRVRSEHPNLPDAEIFAIAVWRLGEGVFDAGKNVDTLIRRSRYGADVPAEISVPTKILPASDGIWEKALSELRLQLTRATFDTWLRDTHLVACEDGVFVVGVANEYARGWLEARLKTVVERVLARLTSEPEVEVRFVVEE